MGNSKKATEQIRYYNLFSYPNVMGAVPIQVWEDQIEKKEDCLEFPGWAKVRVIGMLGDYYIVITTRHMADRPVQDEG